MRTSLIVLLFAGILGEIRLATSAIAGDGPQFSGQDSPAISGDKDLPIEWAENSNIAWKVRIPGRGRSAPVVWNNYVLITAVVSEKPTAHERRSGAGTEVEPIDGSRRWVVLCLDRTSGRILWQSVAAERTTAHGARPTNSCASEAPVADGERVYVYFGRVGLFCFDLSGELIWSSTVGSDGAPRDWEVASSPAFDGDRLFVVCDHEEKTFLVAIDKATGNEVWRASRKEKSAWSSPYVWRNRVRTEVVACGGQRIRSYDPASGKLLWQLGVRGGSVHDNIGTCNATPVGNAELLFVGMGSREANQQFGPLWAVKPAAQGDISLRKSESSSVNIAWYRPDAGPAMGSPVFSKGFLYVLPRIGDTLTCLEATTGDEVYKKQLPGATGFFSSPWAHDGNIGCLDVDGQAFIVRGGTKFKILGVNGLGEKCWSAPAASRGALFVRGVEHLYCLRRSAALQSAE
jgi:outer membrane protein assembly factor BamB